MGWSARSRDLTRKLHLTLLAFAFIVAGAAAFGYTVTYLGSDTTKASMDFAGLFEFHVLIGLVSVVLMLIVSTAAFSLPHFRRVKQQSRHGELRVCIIIIIVIIYLIISAIAIFGPKLVAVPQFIPLYFFYWRILALYLFAFAAAANCFCGLILLGIVQRRKGQQVELEATAGGDVIRDILTARSDLRQFLWGAASLITGVVVVSSGLRNALDAYASNYGGDVGVPTVVLLLYGAFFAALLALISVPSYMAVQARARKLSDMLYPVPHDGRPSAEWYAARSSLESLLQLRAGAGQRFAAVLGILAPLIISIISAFIPTSGGH